jgi:hypothetical protein
MSSGPESGTPPGENWAAIERRLDQWAADRERRRHRSDAPAAAPKGIDDPDHEPVYALVGVTEGGLAVREGAPDGPIFVMEPEEAAACGCKPGTCAIADLFDNDDLPFPGDGI